MKKIPKLSAPLLRAGRDEGVRDHATHEPGDRDPPQLHAVRDEERDQYQFVDQESWV